MLFYYIFHFLVVIILFNALIVMDNWNPLFATFHLLCVFILTGIFFLILGAEFLALNLMILYVGAIAIFFFNYERFINK